MLPYFSLVPVYNFGKIRLLISYWNAMLSACNQVHKVMYLIKNTFTVKTFGLTINSIHICTTVKEDIV
jgi:hypothetical protein